MQQPPPPPHASGVQANGSRSMLVPQLMPPPVPGAVPPLDQLVHPGKRRAITCHTRTHMYTVHLA